jgi:hypothetical protein
MNLPLFATVPAWMSALALVLAIALPTVLWHAFYTTGQHARIAGSRTLSIWLGAIMLAWVAVAVILSLEGFFEADPEARIPNLSGAILPLLAGFILWMAAPGFRESVRAMPPDWLIRVQFYRAVGFIYLAGWQLGLMPAPYAIPAGFGDVIVGFSALWVARMVRLRRPGADLAATIWNLFGLADVAVALTMGVLTSPNPLQVLSKDNPGVVITVFPLALLPTIVVPLSVLCHFYSLKVGTRRALRTEYTTV